MRPATSRRNDVGGSDPLPGARPHRPILCLPDERPEDSRYARPEDLAAPRLPSSRLRVLAFDALIALSVRDIGATLITCNRKDFEEIRRHKQFKVVFW